MGGEQASMVRFLELDLGDSLGEEARRAACLSCLSVHEQKRNVSVYSGPPVEPQRWKEPSDGSSAAPFSSEEGTSRRRWKVWDCAFQR